MIEFFMNHRGREVIITLGDGSVRTGSICAVDISAHPRSPAMVLVGDALVALDHIAAIQLLREDPRTGV